MQKAGFTRVSVDHSVFVKRDLLGDAMVTIHVDDMAVATSNTQTLTTTFNDLQKIIDVVDMGEIHWFLGMAVTRDRKARTIFLYQRAFINTILKRFSMEDSYGVSTPLDPNVVLSKSMSPTSDEEKNHMKRIPYLAGVRSLMYASLATRPDITFVTNKLSQFNSNPGRAHWTALQRVLRYLKHTRNHVLVLGGQGEITLEGYTDSDYAGCVDTHWSTSGYAFTLGCGSISWSLKRQAIVTTSTCEAEYVASCHATKEAMWLRHLLELLGHKQVTSTIHSDNSGSIALMKDPTFHARSKHIDVQYHYTREHVENRDISFHYIPTSEMAADILTKALPRPKHEKFTHMLGIRSCD
jgi:Reverse transcriptase (RNA-dependent DNA polymerase)